jgi:hypothetical protein
MPRGGAGAVIKRTWRRFRRRPTSVQVGSLVAALLILGGAAYGISAATSSNASSTTTSNASQGPTASGISVDQASTSSRGVTATSINVVFPVSNLTSLASNFGFAGDSEFAAQSEAIHTFVNAINDAGGIYGRKINPMIENFDPTNETSMLALCKQWTKGSPPVFAVLDGVGSWEGDSELCITQQGQTPFIGQWSTVDSWTDAGAPYLWWTGPSQTQVLTTLMSWAKGAGLIGGDRKLGIVVGDSPSDQDALNSAVTPALKKLGISADEVLTLPDLTSETAATSSDAPLVVAKLQSAGIDTVLPLITFNALFPYLSAEGQEHFYPKLLLSDYAQSIQLGLGLIPTPYEQELNGQEGITTQTLGGVDDTRPYSQGGYDPGVRACYNTWHSAHPQPLPNQTLIHGEKPSTYIEEQGPISGWCGVINLFAAAAKKAGPDLTRRSFVTGMSNIKSFPGTWSPVLTYGSDKFAGPSYYRVVYLHNNVPASPLCKLNAQGITQGTCWVVTQNWKPLESG